MTLRSRFLVGSSERNPGIDFLRALAIILVMMRHFLDRNSDYDSAIARPISFVGLFGWSGVDLFFVLSGFLIFSIVFKQESQGKFSWRNFYLKRVLRIWPAYFVSLAVCMAVGQFSVVPSQLIYFALFVQNYIGPSLSQLNGGIYWSIAVEEHFYMVAPLLLVVSAYFRKRRLLILLLLVLVPPLLRYIIFETVVHGNMTKFYYQIYFPTHARFDSLAIGVLCAYFVANHKNFLVLPRFKQFLPAVSLVLLAGALLTTESLNLYGQQLSLTAGVFGFSLTALFWASVLLMSETFRIFDRWGRGPMQVIAYLSYSMYLYHIIVLNFWDGVFGSAPKEALYVIAHASAFAVTTVLAGAGSYFLVERYFLMKKQNLQDIGLTSRLLHP